MVFFLFSPLSLQSRRISRLSSLDHSTLNHVDDDEDLDHMDYDKTNTYATNNLLSANQVQPQQQQQQEVFTPPPPQQNLPQQSPVTPPSKPLAPYALFFRDTMTAIKQQNPACTLEQITSIAMNMWESIDEKQKSVYDQRHEQEKREYLRQLRDYQRNQQLEEAMPNPEQSQQQQQQQEPHIPQLQPQEEQQLPQNDVQPSIPPLSIPATETETTTVQSQTQQPPDQIQLLTEAAAVQKCTRDQCNKPAIINPDWEDEYCSNECVVIHCHNVFREWARSLQNSPT